MADLSGLPPGERAKHYRELSDMHRLLAGEAPGGEARAAHLELAALWTRLASQAEHQARDAGRPRDQAAIDTADGADFNA
ncbi:MAG: hypothetical protein E7812_10240 [Phenylobacterium sp.]|nr:MAG: hypothetical protein E7812_10240 [Phenylobacterium sp.]